MDLTGCSFADGRFRNNVLNSEPCFVHFNGYQVNDYVMINEATGAEEDIREVFLGMSDTPSIRYDYSPTFYYNGKAVRPVPQLSTV